MRQSILKKIVVSILVISLIIVLVPVYSTASESTDGSDEFQSIYTEDDLKKMDLSGKYRLENDIELKEGEWETLGVLRGILDGNGHTISNLKRTNGGYLFSDIGVTGVLKDITISGNIETEEEDAALIAYCCYGKAINCKTEGVVKCNNETKNPMIAGMFCQVGGKAENCTNYATVSGGYGGGITNWNNGALINCVNNGEISTTNNDVGGIECQDNQYSLTSNCINNGTVTVKRTSSCANRPIYAAGISGKCMGVIRNCTNNGLIAGDDVSGGIVGEVQGNGMIIGCKNTGSIMCNNESGGICGSLDLTSGYFNENDQFCPIYGYILVANCENRGELITVYDSERSNEIIDIGGICGRVDTMLGDILIKECTNLGKIIDKKQADTIVDSVGIGGIVSEINICKSGNVTIKGCENLADIESDENMESVTNAGGIFESATTEEGSIKVLESGNSGDISALSVSGIGITNQGTEIGYCYNSGSLNGWYVCGISRNTNSNMTMPKSIHDCYNSGSLNGKRTYGIFGEKRPDSMVYNCCNLTTQLQGVYETQAIGGETFEENQGEDVSTETEQAFSCKQCYYIGQNQAEAYYGTAIQEDDMLNESTFSGFDFEQAPGWKIDATAECPLTLNLEYEEEIASLAENSGTIHVVGQKYEVLEIQAAKGKIVKAVSLAPDIVGQDWDGNIIAIGEGKAEIYVVFSDGQICVYNLEALPEELELPTPVEPTPSATPVSEVQPTPSATPVSEVQPTPSATPVSEERPTPSAMPVSEVQPTPSAMPVSEVQPTPSAMPVSEVQPTPSATPASESAVTSSLTHSAKSSLKKQKITTAKNKKYNAKMLKNRKIKFGIKAKTSGNGSLSYDVISYPSKAGKYISVSKSGQVTLKKGIKKGIYKIRITASRTSKYLKGTKEFKIQIK